MTSVRTYKQSIAYLKSLEGKALNPDGAYGFQCFDVANQYWLYLFGHTLKGVGAADIPTWNTFTGEATCLLQVMVKVLIQMIQVP